MKPLVSLLLGLWALNASSAEVIRQVILDPLQVTRIPVARDRLCVVRFPSAISDLEGAFLSPDPEPPAIFQISFRPGSTFFSLRALASNATVAVAVVWRGQTYVLECFESAEPLLSVIFTVPSPRKSALSSPPSPARLQSILKIARWHETVEQQRPDLLAGVERRSSPNQLSVFQHSYVWLEDVFRFDADDALVLRLSLRNTTTATLRYNPHTLAVNVGQRTFVPAAVDADGLVPPCGHATILIVIAAGIRGTPAAISLRNDFTVAFEWLLPSSGQPCLAPTPSAPSQPFRSPRHESLLSVR